VAHLAPPLGDLTEDPHEIFTGDLGHISVRVAMDKEAGRNEGEFFVSWDDGVLTHAIKICPDANVVDPDDRFDIGDVTEEVIK